MLRTLAVSHYRSLWRLVAPLARLTVITGPNGSGKSSLYRSLRLLAATARGGIVPGLAREGGLPSALWAGPEKISRAMEAGAWPVEGQVRSGPVRLRLGFSGDDLGYSISLGHPTPSRSAFTLDPEIKRECIWAGPSYRPAAALVDRDGPMVRVRLDEARDGSSWRVVETGLEPFDGLFDRVADPAAAPEVLRLRETIRAWRFYDHFRTDPDAPARVPRPATRTPVLHHDGRDLAAALQTILEIGDAGALAAAVDQAFPGSRIEIRRTDDAHLVLGLRQPGLLRPLATAELSDGTLRFLLWVAALLTPRPPSLMVLNEPETSLHEDLVAALSGLVFHAAGHTQVWVVTHSGRLVNALRARCDPGETSFLELEKDLGRTGIRGLRSLDEPPWVWPDRD